MKAASQVQFCSCNCEKQLWHHCCQLWSKSHLSSNNDLKCNQTVSYGAPPVHRDDFKAQWGRVRPLAKFENQTCRFWGVPPTPIMDNHKIINLIHLIENSCLYFYPCSTNTRLVTSFSLKTIGTFGQNGTATDENPTV